VGLLVIPVKSTYATSYLLNNINLYLISYHLPCGPEVLFQDLRRNEIRDDDDDDLPDIVHIFNQIISCLSLMNYFSETSENIAISHNC